MKIWNERMSCDRGEKMKMVHEDVKGSARGEVKVVSRSTGTGHRGQTGSR